MPITDWPLVARVRIFVSAGRSVRVRIIDRQLVAHG